MEDAFVISDASNVSALEKNRFYKKINVIETGDLGKMDKSHLVKSITMLDTISSSKDLKTQRGYLFILNEDIVSKAINIESPSEPLYVQKCPMTNSNKSGMWLSKEKEIKNPYYGEAMLSCGSTIDSLK
ncbi:hypothetical protein [uncultured Maribacter sp.]|uniref:hypothetical protein n=1 Tax=uncultured Maribacter sp. TaxID=431308 RepID=UPI002623960F|nr:hypothetical protein [uncultured Maribacter sp.]